MKVSASLFLLAGIAYVFQASPSLAHSGGLDANGCHAGSQPYHCHRGARAGAARVNSPLLYSADRDCGDFSSWEEAQNFFEASAPGDPHRLDADGDGLACESLR